MIETERLILRPLTYDQLLKYAREDNSLELEFCLNENSRKISPELKEALEQTIIPEVANTFKNYLFSTLWSIISKTDNKLVGDLCFFGEPDSDGEIKIGYGTFEEFRNRGFMTEAIKGIIKWTETQPNVFSIAASIDKDNNASFKILEKNYFKKISETEKMYYWKLYVKKCPAI